jgi:hypothetical protein
MTKPLSLAIAIVVVALVASTATPQLPPAQKSHVFSNLAPGQTVTLNDNDRMFQINTIQGAKTGTHTVAEVGGDYIVLQDVADVTELRIPIHAIRAVVHVKTKAK